MRSTGRERGTTILELLIALLIASLALTVAARILAASLRHVALEDQRVLETEASLATQQIRADVISADGGGGTWGVDDELELHTPSGLDIFYRVEGLRLLRKVGTGERTVLDRVRRFRWQWLPSLGKQILLIELAYERTRRPGPLVAGGQRVVAPFELYQESLVLTLRGRGGVGW